MGVVVWILSAHTTCLELMGVTLVAVGMGSHVTALGKAFCRVDKACPIGPIRVHACRSSGVARSRFLLCLLWTAMASARISSFSPQSLLLVLCVKAISNIYLDQLSSMFGNLN